MAKLVVSLNGKVVGNYFLDIPNFSIGSLEDNDLCLTAPGISRVHARIMSVGNDDIIEDLGSTNGTLVNGKQITTHILQQDDVIELASYRVRYRSHTAIDGPSFDRTMVIETLVGDGAVPSEAVGVHALATARRARPHKEGDRTGLVKALNGAHAGEEIELLALLRTFGVAGKQVAVINRRPTGYFITHVEGRRAARVNGKSIGAKPRPLNANDVIEVGAQKLQFLLR
ncbi:MAG: FHA domain-containing protein [Betaproteobacteria bacterium]